MNSKFFTEMKVRCTTRKKFRKMKKVFLLMTLLTIAVVIHSQSVTEKLMSVTTSSKSALSLYGQAIKYLDDVRLDKAIETFKKALKQDPDFFMANYQLAFFYLLNRDQDNFDEYAEAAINCKVTLSDAEKLLKDALVRLKKGQSNLIDLGEKLVEMFPNDPNSYSNLIYFQSLAGDSVTMVKTLEKAIKIARNPATFYNQLGYAYLTLKENDKAKEAFDKYIELEPDNPNVYDSKGDYFMFIKKFDKAYESYMKANSMDPSFSHDKADLARKLYESTEGKSLDIISM
jgi:Tfp pilus assembly protein PilF